MFSEIVFWIKWALFRVLIYTLCFISDLYYWGKGKTVPPIENPLLFKSATSLARDIKEGSIKSEDVVQAYIDRIREVEPYINAIVEDRFEGALEEARAVDALIQSGKLSSKELENDKPFLGVPFTVKLLLKVKGMKNTAGSILFKDMVADEDAPSVSLMKKAGGIVLAISNASEFGFLCETNNSLYGRTCNPYDTSRTSGGSSGGESALLGAGASVIGLGNDLAGSIRVPAHFTGVFAHKATIGVIPNSGSFPSPPGKLNKCTYTGPMCRYVEDLVTMTKVLSSTENKSSLNFDAPVDFKKLKIYYSTGIKDCRVVSLDKVIEDAMFQAINHFTLNYEASVRELKIPHFDESNYVVVHLLQDSIPNIVKFLTLGKVKKINLFIEVVKWFMKKSVFCIESILVLCFARNPIVFDKKLIPYYREVIEKLTVDFDNLLDENTVFLYPCFSRTAPHHYQAQVPLLANMCYAGIFNFLGLPSTVVPLGLNQKGMPFAIQVIGAKNNDPLTLACAAELSKVFGGWIPPGCR